MTDVPKLSLLERLTLRNQFLILDALKPGEGYDRYVQIVERGYVSEYELMFDHLSDVSEDDAEFVNDIMQVYEVLQIPFLSKEQGVPSDRQFPGFDGNSETGLIGYLRYLRSDGRWSHIVTSSPGGSLNGHFPWRDMYARMIAQWEGFGRPHEISNEQAEKIMGARVHPDNRKA